MSKQEILDDINTSVGYVIDSIYDKVESLSTVSDNELRMKIAATELRELKALRDQITDEVCKILVDNTNVLISKDKGDILTMSRGIAVTA